MKIPLTKTQFQLPNFKEKILANNYSLRSLALALILFFGIQDCFAQFEYELYGYVSDSASGQVLKGVSITINNSQTIQTNNSGYFSAKVAPYENNLNFHLKGYKKSNTTWNITNDTMLNIKLAQIPLNYDSFLNPSAQINSFDDVEGGKMDMPLDMFDNLPQLGDEPDLFRSMHKMAGVDFGNEVSNGLNIRGGSNDQNLILYNDIPVYKSTQLFNTLSYQMAPLQEVSLYKGAAPARFGGRLSSVVDMASNDGIVTEAENEFSISFATVKFNLNIPLKPEVSSMNFSVRRSYLDLLFPQLFFENDNAFNFYDINFGFQRKLKDDAKLSVFSLFAKDNLLLSFDDTSSAGTTTYTDGVFSYNLLAGVNYEKRLMPGLFGKIGIGYTGNGLRLLIKEQNLNQPVGVAAIAETEFTFGNYDYILNADLYANRFNKHQLNFGANIINHNYATGELKERNEDVAGTELEKVTTGNSEPDRTFEMAIYGEDQYQINEKVKVIAGARAVYYSNSGFNKMYFEPRLRMRYELDKKTAFKLAYARNNQFSHFLSYATGNFFSARWVPATERVQAQSSNQFTGTFTRMIKNNRIFNVDAYYKTLNNILISEDGFISDVLHWEDLVIPGEGRAYGIETSIQGTKASFGYLASYTLSWAKRKYEGINSDEFFDYDFDRRHMFKASGYLEFLNEDQLALNYSIGSGRPFSVPNSKYRDIDGRIILGYDEINNYRSPFYHRMDISYTKRTFRIAAVESYFKFTIYNILAVRNASRLDLELDKTVNQGIVYKANLNSFLVFIPSISYNLKF